MVGVPGRSGGCHTCRKRRVKCDEGKPTCKRCEKAGYTCAGYEKPLHFRIAVASASGTASSSSSTSTDQNVIAMHHRNRYDYLQQQTANTVPNSLNLEAFRPDICHAFLFENFVWRSYGQEWLRLAAIGRYSPLALQASLALSQSSFAKFYGQQNVETNASIEYGKAIRALIPQLSNAVSPDSHAQGLLVPVMILLIYESIRQDPTGTTSHVRGMIQLLMVFGPTKFQQQPLRSAFESCRATLITVGIISKRRCFLEDDSWINIPWALDPASKSQQNQLADILVTVPGMLEDDGRLSQQPDPGPHVALVERVKRQLKRAFRWRWHWQELYSATVYEKPASPAPADPSAKSRMFESILQFTEFERATEISLYNAVQMWLIGLLWKIAPSNAPAIIMAAAQPPSTHKDSSAYPYFSSLSLPGMSVALRDPAIEICRVFEFQCANVQHSKDPALFYMLPIGLAYSVLEHQPRFRDWLVSMLDQSPITSKYVIGQNSMGFGFYLSSAGLHEAISVLEESERTTSPGVWHGLQPRQELT
ncbi:hypothetical protein NA57DRAFT_57545 [Rhizodiscina lignyota]|uniref:Zn(2)-C6 fungal-type domain-containing protein n=1 Tax=Rhizodiscina lignyota TaxID=1504668 RepID=A0A9P4IAQ0_9PEZI|nr:hypothetical protein NA57DRAFT_57545 [Rhizodiscina lignyota]